jgi:hypothetical protein
VERSTNSSASEHRLSGEFSLKRMSLSFASSPTIQQEDTHVDAMFNAMDGYAALLCCAFLGADLFRSLCLLGTIGDAALMDKSKGLLLDILLGEWQQALRQ